MAASALVVVFGVFLFFFFFVVKETILAYFKIDISMRALRLDTFVNFVNFFFE